ncbi:CBS domain-containing protein [Lactococcus insecticola]|uniref:CBS domain-containing protein n=1 Tax=Pseudolactococcus insecticola TaxID=2709158 RepID=A0A6A0B8A3_9LACT|nr:CBS domain-containing protein [Lactococcus insecticola]GFH40893.1 hypothetical protein Hs20B_12910 [Lactococcus insecticola]
MNETFIEIYKEIEAFANKKFNQTGKYMPMSQLTDELIEHVAGAKDFATDFELFNNLRNMMQHKASDKYFLIQPEVVDLIRHVYEVITQPLTVGSLFRSEVIFVPSDAAFSDLMTLVRTHHHTQFPVVKNGRVLTTQLITANAIVHSLSENPKAAPTVEQILENSQAVIRFIKPDDSIFTAENRLLDEMKTGQKSVVLLITEVENLQTLKPSDVLGVINITDLPKILSQK